MNSIKFTLLVFILGAFGLGLVNAQVLPKKNERNNEDGVNGLIVNMTLTNDGLNFFRSFLEFWREKPDNERYSLEIGERPSKRLGNQVWVNYGQKRFFTANLPPKLDKIRGISEQAADATYEGLISLALQLNEAKEPDLAGEEL
jgi:curli production assembly/transport component CsgE